MTSRLHTESSAQRALQPAVWSKLRAVAVGLSMLAACAAWAGPTVIYVATDLTDTVVGEDLWRYDYTISGPVDGFGSINLLFSPSSYANLQSQTLDPNLFLVDVQPDAVASADGIVYVTPLTGLLATDMATLSVEFTWLGGPGGTPGAQPFEIVDGGGNPAGTGTTALLPNGAVPEPSTLVLTATALLALSVKRKRGVRGASGKAVAMA